MPARKRSAPELVASRRRSGRLSSTPKKSSYFEDNESDVDDDELPPKKRRGQPSKRESLVKEEEEEQVEIIPLEKMRGTGGVEYEDHKLHRNTLLFLKDLKANNKRPWLKSHDDEYRRSLKDWQSFVEAATQSIISIDETVPELPAKDVIFRIHRDIRFSKDPTPYKPHFSAAWSRTGRKGPYACYYVHCEPGASFIGGGLWPPEARFVAKLRHSVDRHPERWRRALNEPLFKKAFFPGVKASADPEVAVKAFVDRNQENALKKRPMGYVVSHRDIALLKLRNYTIGTKIDADMLCKDDAQDKVGEIMQALSSFVSFLNGIVMPDPNLDDSSSDEDEDENEDEGGD
ncbi:hypothetical protein TOPH_07214 [Tolypocladium ophioglossoides CBS 100239]|uniref:DUF2461 domain-containing protein n=1 Tax=Tolypocladium ophioglossoides (strain CBS 100239) TaxID=1163406 RepID=A0A0L0N230_TOLOC|nr:hypothetical protein TOPH_07214 [Tolypocladium ophioglossoides CBS 100239]